jgi:hypothetical protein
MRGRAAALLVAAPLLLAACGDMGSTTTESITFSVAEPASPGAEIVTGAVGEDVTITYTRDEANPGFTFWTLGGDDGVLSSVADVDNETSIPCVGTVTFEALKPGVTRLAFADADDNGNVVGPTTLYKVRVGN